jgi:hypothetical protein
VKASRWPNRGADDRRDHDTGRPGSDRPDAATSLIERNLSTVNAFRDGSIVTYACDIVGGLDRSAWAYYVRGLRYRNTCPHSLTDN